MKSNMDAWTEARKDLTSKMDNMSHQPTGRYCMPTLAAIDADWVVNYNNYVEIYNNMYPGSDWSSSIHRVEQQMKDVLERIRLAPTFCY
jgi:hypothetical protein